MLERITALLDKYDRLFKYVAAILVATAGSIWAVVTLVYPHLILPMIEPAKLDIEITTQEVGRRADYSVHQVNFKLKNVGINRLYVPSTYFLIRANEITKARRKTAKKKKDTAESKAVSEVVSATLKKLTAEERKAVRAQASNYLFNKRWERTLPTDNFSRNLLQQAFFDLHDESFAYLQFGRLTGIHHLLEPGESSERQILAFVPRGYDVVQIDCRAAFAKDNLTDLVFVGAPHPEGLYVFPFERSSDMESKLSKFKESLKDKLSSGEYDTLLERYSDTVFFVTERLQVFVTEENEETGSVTKESKEASSSESQSPEVLQPKEGGGQGGDG